MLKQNLGMQIDHVVGEPKETYERMYKGEIQLMWIRWYADYPDPNNMQWQVFYGGHTTGRRQVWKNPDFDKLVNDARGVTDTAKRMQMYQRRRQDHVGGRRRYLRLLPVQLGMLKPWVTGMPKNAAGDCGALREHLRSDVQQAGRRRALTRRASLSPASQPPGPRGPGGFCCTRWERGPTSVPPSAGRAYQRLLPPVGSALHSTRLPSVFCA